MNRLFVCIYSLPRSLTHASVHARTRSTFPRSLCRGPGERFPAAPPNPTPGRAARWPSAQALEAFANICFGAGWLKVQCPNLTTAESAFRRERGAQCPGAEAAFPGLPGGRRRPGAAVDPGPRPAGLGGGGTRFRRAANRRARAAGPPSAGLGQRPRSAQEVPGAHGRAGRGGGRGAAGGPGGGRTGDPSAEDGRGAGLGAPRWPELQEAAGGAGPGRVPRPAGARRRAGPRTAPVSPARAETPLEPGGRAGRGGVAHGTGARAGGTGAQRSRG